MTCSVNFAGSPITRRTPVSRMYFKRATTTKDEEPDPDLRVLEVMKANYGPTGETVNLRWKEGVFVPIAAPGSLERMARDNRIDELFLLLLDRLMAQGRNLSHKSTANTYAPSVFVGQPEATKDRVTKRDLVDAMERLFHAGKIHVAPYGKPSKGFTRIERK